MLVPSIAGVMWAEYYVIRRRTLVIEPGVNKSAIVSWLAGSVVAWVTTKYSFGLPPINGILVAALCFVVLSSRRQR